MFENTVIIFIFLVLQFFHHSDGAVGDPCVTRHTRTEGVCKIITDCPEAEEKSKKSNAGLTLCGYYQFNTPIVCCKQNSYVPNDGSFPTEDAFVFPDQITVNKNKPLKRISERKCDDYNKNTTTVIQAIPLIPNPEPTNQQISHCVHNSVPLIVGGQAAVAEEFPFMVAVGYDVEEDKWRCGGTLISESFVLTAAHCASTSRGPPTVIRVGELFLKFGVVDENEDRNHNDFKLSRVISHPDYHPPFKYNDVALLQTDRKIVFTNAIRPACLYTSSILNHNITIATGWGRTGDFAEASEELRKVALNIYDNSICNRRYRNKDDLPRGISSTMLCAGSLEGGKDTCQGDSGGPLVVTNEGNHCKFYVIGITSFGIFCAQVNTPAVYTRVSEYVSWIEGIVWPDE